MHPLSRMLAAAGLAITKVLEPKASRGPQCMQRSDETFRGSPPAVTCTRTPIFSFGRAEGASIQVQGPHGAAPPDSETIRTARSRPAGERRAASEEGQKGFVRQGASPDEGASALAEVVKRTGGRAVNNSMRTSSVQLPARLPTSAGSGSHDPLRPMTAPRCGRYLASQWAWRT